ncbi:MAG: hypothetical protein A2077_03395 [Nitrospirae bacterium GWC2_46_6]|nr:MAG: hypothetical protein A2077_03395 [Nitrospirae bacterium GWC2_46_6]OGW21003.1 MAG: hypothetical protein A2Z82_03755 [Nitrospirae bacterium GWA2_46_11]OGW22807.1 MAG: hypothetical protein A2X55_02685 [Nitrospirae bacterium GWB2_47_37]HAK89821.1 hypothetical protein [Nitrospiraceae bacterium]HCL81546.1 hypothetical protein [Nitrospiraceae bacterium]
MMEESAYIKRLKERLRQRPDSKLFLSFAEELRRRDMIDEAIVALMEGIKKNPEFITAHLALGRWYLSSDMLPEAKKEFLEAAEKSPDNIFARKGLAEIYKRMEEEESAVEEYKKVLEINPHDKDAAAYLAARGYSFEKPEAQEVESGEAGVVLESHEEPEVKRGEDAIDRLNLFLVAVKGRFAFSRKDAVTDRLSRMLKEINIRFAKLTPAAPSYKD